MGLHTLTIKPGTGKVSGLFKKKAAQVIKIINSDVNVKTEPVKSEYTGPYDICSICGPFRRGYIRKRIVWDGSQFLCGRCAKELYGNSVLCLVSSTYIS